jgi:hypothetical protein
MGQQLLMKKLCQGAKKALQNADIDVVEHDLVGCFKKGGTGMF